MTTDMSLRQRNTNTNGDTAVLLPRKYNENEVLRVLPTPILHRKSIQRLLLKSSIIIVVLAITILSFGTVYSKVTSRNACQVLHEFRRDNVLLDLPRFFHFQSKTRDITKETKSWMDVLSMDPIVQEYPNIISNSSSAWSAVYWSDESCKRLVEDHFPKFLQTYDSFPRNIQRVDSCRYLILSTYGGVYADTDISIHTSNADEFEHLIPEGVGLVESPYRYNEVWQNSLMTASYTGHVLWNMTLEIIEERIDKNNAVLSLTGPKMIGDAVDRFRHRYADDSNVKQDIQTLPCELFQRLPQGNWDTTVLNILGREILARAIPMQGCGKYGDGICEITRHTGKASWTSDAGIS